MSAQKLLLLVAVSTFILSPHPLRAADPKPAPPAKPKWDVTHQLVQGQPWTSAKKTEQALQAEVKESEATPDQRLVFALNDLAGWYRAKARYEEAEKIYRRVLDIQIKRGLELHHDLALTHNDLGVVLTDAGKLEEAEKCFKTAKEIWEKRWDGPLPTEDYAVTLHNYSVLLEKAGRGDEGKSLETKADEVMAARKKAFGF